MKGTNKNSDKQAEVPAKPRLTRKERDEHFAAHIPSVLNYHTLMLADGLRNRLLAKAIRQSVTAETSFLDIGAGTGVWAILAAKLGAKRVVAVEVEECLIPIIYKHAQENGVADRIEIIYGNSNDVKLKGRFDLIVSELFGGDALGEATVKSFVDIRERFLAPGGILIPQKLKLMAAPAHFDESSDRLPVGLPLSVGFLRSIKLNYGRAVLISDRDKIRILADPKPLLEIDFRTVTDAAKLENLTASWKLRNMKKANAIVIFNQSTFTESIEMDAFRSQSWGVTINEFVPFDIGAGELSFRTTLDSKQGNWTVSVPSDPSRRAQNFGPIFSFARIRMAQKTTPHRSTRKAKSPQARKSKRPPNPRRASG